MMLLISNSPDWLHARRVLRHLLLAVASLTAAGLLFQWGEDGRRAATQGDLDVRAMRAAVRAFFHWHDAVSVLEHALSGLGMALVGATILQLFYASDPGPNSVPVSAGNFRLFGVGRIGQVSALAGEFRRRHPLQCRVRTCLVIVLAPHLDFASGVRQ
jgi:hypothetical protein